MPESDDPTFAPEIAAKVSAFVRVGREFGRARQMIHDRMPLSAVATQIGLLFLANDDDGANRHANNVLGRRLINFSISADSSTSEVGWTIAGTQLVSTVTRLTIIKSLPATVGQLALNSFVVSDDADAAANIDAIRSIGSALGVPRLADEVDDARFFLLHGSIEMSGSYQANFLGAQGRLVRQLGRFIYPSMSRAPVIARPSGGSLGVIR